MGFYVAVNFSFSTNSLRRLKEVANKTLADLKWPEPSEKRKDFKDSYTHLMLQQVADKTDKFIFPGNKGDMFIWGGVWNYYSAEAEIPWIKEFLKRCWEYGGVGERVMFDFDRALLIVNPEDSETSYLYEISWDLENKTVNVRESASELNWEQC